MSVRVLHRADVAEVDGRARRRCGSGSSAARRRSSTIELIGTIGISSPMRTLPDGLIDVAGGQRADDLVGRHAVRRAAGRDRRGRRWCAGCRRTAAGPRRPGSVANIGRTLNSARSWISPTAARLAREHEVADRHAAGVEPHDERRDGARRHEGPRAVDVADRLGHRLGHVGAGVEVQLHQGHALDVLRLDVVDAADVEEVVLVVVGDAALPSAPGPCRRRAGRRR